MGQSDVTDEFGDRVVHGGNRRLLGVSLDVMDTFLDGMGRSLFFLSYTMLVHPLLGFPLVTVRKGQSISMKTQSVTLSCFLSVSGDGVVSIVFTTAK